MQRFFYRDYVSFSFIDFKNMIENPLFTFFNYSFIVIFLIYLECYLKLEFVIFHIL